MGELKTSIYLLGAVALVFVISILTFYVHTAIIVGYLPTYANPDPSTIDSYSIYDPLIYFALALWLLSFFVWLLVAGIYMYKMKENVQIRPLFGSFLAQVLAWVVFSSEILNWFLD